MLTFYAGSLGGPALTVADSKLFDDAEDLPVGRTGNYHLAEFLTPVGVHLYRRNLLEKII